MIIGLIKYHLVLLIKDPMLVIFGLAFPFAQMFLAANSPVGIVDYYVNTVELGMVTFMNIAAMVLCWGAGYNHSYSREIKFLRRLRMSPVKPVHYLVSGILLNIGVLLVFTVALVIVAVTIFDINLADRNWVLIIAMLLLTFAMFYALGMFVANALKKAKNSQTLSYIVFGGMIVAINLFVVDGVPSFLQEIARNTPIAYATNVLQAAWVGTDLFYGHDFIAMLVCIVVLSLLSIKFFKYE